MRRVAGYLFGFMNQRKPKGVAELMAGVAGSRGFRRERLALALRQSLGPVGVGD